MAARPRERAPLMGSIVPDQRLALPRGAHIGTAGAPVDRASSGMRSTTGRPYRVDSKLARAVAWMESGFQQDVVSSAGAIGVMQLLPETWEWVDAMLLGGSTPRTYDGNVRAGVRYLRWQLDQFDGDVSWRSRATTRVPEPYASGACSTTPSSTSP